MRKDYKKLPRTGHSRFENPLTQAIRTEKVFNNPSVLVEAWYPLCEAAKLKKGEARSFLVLTQRVVVWRGDDGSVRALDAFCPHMGADLGNGQVIGNQLRCYFHHWSFGGDGELIDVPCTKKPKGKIKLSRYPIQEYLGHIWIYAGHEARTPLIKPSGLEDEELHALRLATPTLFAHHHVMMAGGIDLQHFATVHQVHIDFDFEFVKSDQWVYEWRMSGPISPRSWRGRLGRILIGPRLSYTMRIGSGSMVSISYGRDQRFMGRYFKLPVLQILWGCLPLASGVSKVTVFSVVKKQKGIWGRIKMTLQHLLTLLLITFLRDDDVKAFPNMRFQVDNPMPEDKPVLQLIHTINQLPESPWTKVLKEVSGDVSKDSVLSIGL